MATQAETAAHLDMSERNIRDLLKKLGLPSRNLDLDQVRISYIRHLRATAGRHQVGDGDLNLTAERAKLARAQRERTEIEVAGLKGKMVDADEVKNEAFEVARRTRDRIMNLPDRLAASLAGASDVAGMRQILARELRAALESLAGEHQEHEEKQA